MILAVDPGTNRLGWAVFDGDRLVNYGTITARGDLSQRLDRIIKDLQALFVMHSPRTVSVETPFVGKYPKAALALGQIVGIVKAIAYHEGAVVREYSPTDVKNAVCHGRASKANVATMVQAIYGLDETPAPDEADAIAVGCCHLAKLQQQQVMIGD